jgi:hypothetical protein
LQKGSQYYRTRGAVPLFQLLAKKPELLLLIYSLLLAIPTASLQRLSAHSTSRLATVESLVVRGTFAIEASTYADTIDKVKIGTHFYSHQPPAHAVLGAIAYFPMHRLGLRFGEGRNAAYFLLTFATNGLSTILALLLFFRSLAWRDLGWNVRLLFTAGVACGTLVLPYSTTFNVHGFVAAWLFIGFYFLVTSGIGEYQRPSLFLSGIAFSLCAAMDHGTVFFYIAFVVSALIRRVSRKAILWFLLPACLTLLPTAAYYYFVGGSFKPFAARPELFSYPGSFWTQLDDPALNLTHEKLTGGQLNSLEFALRYGFLCLFGPHGFLIFNPLIWIAIWGLVRTIRHRLQFWCEAVAIASASLAMMLYYFFASTNFGGWSYSVRWFVAMLFLWWFFAPAVADLLASRKWIVAVLSAVSVLYAVGGVAEPWPNPGLGYAAPLANIMQVLRHSNLLGLRTPPVGATER